MKVAILNSKERMIICGDIKLIPGANYVDGAIVEKNQKILDQKIKDGCISIPKPEVDDDLDDTVLGAFNANDAIKLVKETNDADTLLSFQIEEQAGKKRVTVLKAIEDQVKLNKDAVNPTE